MTLPTCRHRAPMLLKLGVTACFVLACFNADASSDEPYDRYVNRGGTDIALARYQAGELGVLLPSYDRTYLYSAWRAVALGDERKNAPNPPNGLLQALGSKRGGWLDTASGKQVYAAWQDAIAAALKRPNPAPAKGDRLPEGDLSCPMPAYTFATATLTGLARRPDATPARLTAWVASQRQVFKFCGDDPDAARIPYGEPKPPVAPLTVLPAAEALYWRQLQQYQLASAAFYGGNYAVSGKLYSEIGATPQHPLRAWGAYLNLRSLARAANVEPPPGAMAKRVAPEVRLAGIEAAARQIVQDPSLAPLHEASRAIVRASQARLTPQARYAELSNLLDDPKADPYVDDHLGDWRVLADGLLTGPHTAAQQALRSDTGFVDWIQTLRMCSFANIDTAKTCTAEREHALQQWRKFAAKGQPAAQARVWLLAAATLNDTLPQDVEQAALRVDPSAPEYLSLRYRLARHYRLSSQPVKARAIADAVLGGAPLTRAASIGARNEFLQERFALATTPADGAAHLLRSVTRELDSDTGELSAAAESANGASLSAPQPAADGLRWLNRGLATADLLPLADNPGLPQQLRGRIAVAAWMRADLLGQGDAALAASRKVAALLPSLAPLARQYADAGAAPQRRHVMLVGGIRYGLSPVVGYNAWRDDSASAQRDADDMLADLWCSIPGKVSARRNDGDGDDDWNSGTEQAPAMADTGNGALRDSEMAQLGKLKTATGFIGDYALARAASTPDDPDLPWLLHVVVQSTKGGCLDDGAKALSKTAFTLLHKRYKNSEWAKNTPYFY